MKPDLTDVAQRCVKKQRSGEFPGESLTVVACRCSIQIGSKGWKKAATRKLNAAIDELLGVEA